MKSQYEGTFPHNSLFTVKSLGISNKRICNETAINNHVHLYEMLATVGHNKQSCVG